MAHTISFDNITNGETLSYPLLLLKGTVISRNVSTGCALPDDVVVNSAQYKLSDGSFRCLVHLALGENLLSVKYCCSERNLNLTYVARASSRIVRPLYVVFSGHDGRFQAPSSEQNDPASACRRIDTCTELLQTVLAEKLYELDFGRKTFTASPCQVFRSKLEHSRARKLNSKELWTQLAQEIADIGRDGEKYFAFLSSTWYNGDRYRAEMTRHEDLVKITDVYVALGGGNLAAFGTACLYTWPQNVESVIECFQDDRIVDKTQFLDDSAYRGTRGGCFATTLGSVLHELCHTFGLAHTDTGIMGRGFDDIQNVFLIRPIGAPKHAEIMELSRRSVADPVSIKVKNVDKKSFIRRPQFSDEVINRTARVDDVYFTKSSACILAYHKWFNDYPAIDKYVLSYDGQVQLVKSTQGIRVIEIRRGDDEYVAANWCFPGKILKYSFQIDEESARETAGGGATLFVEDNAGNILTYQLFAP